MAKSLLADKSAICRYGSHVRDYLHVHDAGNALTALLESDVTGPVNVASGRPANLDEIATRLAAAAGRGHVKFEMGEPSADNPPEISAVTERLSKEVKWAPSITLDEGLRSVVNTLRLRRQSRAA
jgi:nucleoside-diphosphate-sugar epimerase